MWGIFGVHKQKWFSVKDGWVDHPDKATQFCWKDKQEYIHMPFGGVWQRLPANAKMNTGFEMKVMNE